VAREGFLKDKCGPRAKKFEHHCSTRRPVQQISHHLKKRLVLHVLTLMMNNYS